MMNWLMRAFTTAIDSNNATKASSSLNGKVLHSAAKFSTQQHKFTISINHFQEISLQDH